MILQTDLSLKYIYKPAKEGVRNPKLLLLLHGYGSNERDLFSFADELPEEFFIISVRAPIELSYGGYAWYDINFMDAEKFNDVAQANEAILKIREFIEVAVDKFHLNRDKVWLCGFSQGAILSNALVLKNPQNIESVMMLSGYVAEDIVGELNSQTYDKVAYFISHGLEDTIIPIEWARETPIFLNKLNIKNQYKEYRSGHGLVPQNFYDLLSWIEKRNNI